MATYRRSVYCTEQTNEEFPACDVKGSMCKCSSEVCTMKSADLLCIITLYTFGCNLWNKACEFSTKGPRRKQASNWTQKKRLCRLMSTFYSQGSSRTSIPQQYHYHHPPPNGKQRKKSRSTQKNSVPWEGEVEHVPPHLIRGF